MKFTVLLLAVFLFVWIIPDKIPFQKMDGFEEVEEDLRNLLILYTLSSLSKHSGEYIFFYGGIQ